MHRTAFATKPRSEPLEDAVALHKNPPKPIGVFAVVRAVLLVFIERDRVFNLVRHVVDLDRQFQIIQRLHDSLIELRD